MARSPATTIVPVSEALGPDADGLPLFPPLPGSRPVSPPGARSVARLVAGLRTAVLTALTDDLAAMVVFVEHEPVDGVAVRGSLRVVGPDALDEIADAPVEDVAVTEVPAELARVVGSYFLPTELRAVPAGLVAPEDFVRSLARPGQRGCLLVRAGEALGMVFLAGGRVVLAYREDGPVGGFEQVAPLFGIPGAALWARLGPDAEVAAPPAEATVAPVPAPVPPPRPEPEAPATAALDAAVEAAREVLGAHAVRVEAALRRAEPTVDGLRAAAESLRRRRVRLISPATMELVADRVSAALDRRP